MFEKIHALQQVPSVKLELNKKTLEGGSKKKTDHLLQSKSVTNEGSQVN